MNIIQWKFQINTQLISTCSACVYQNVSCRFRTPLVCNCPFSFVHYNRLVSVSRDYVYIQRDAVLDALSSVIYHIVLDHYRCFKIMPNEISRMLSRLVMIFFHPVDYPLFPPGFSMKIQTLISQVYFLLQNMLTRLVSIVCG